MKKIKSDKQLNLFSDDDFEDTKPIANSELKRNKNESIRKKTKSTLPNQMAEEVVSIMEKGIYDHTDLFNRLSQSKFRRQFHLTPNDIKYIESKGMNALYLHAADFISKRLAPACIINDGKQTPMRGHPVFLAQHATACCCRGCFEKWHHIPAGHPLTLKEQAYAVSVLMTWIKKEYHKFK